MLPLQSTETRRNATVFAGKAHILCAHKIVGHLQDDVGEARSLLHKQASPLSARSLARVYPIGQMHGSGSFREPGSDFNITDSLDMEASTSSCLQPPSSDCSWEWCPQYIGWISPSHCSLYNFAVTGLASTFAPSHDSNRREPHSLFTRDRKSIWFICVIGEMLCGKISGRVPPFSLRRALQVGWSTSVLGPHNKSSPPQVPT